MFNMKFFSFRAAGHNPGYTGPWIVECFLFVLKLQMLGLLFLFLEVNKFCQNLMRVSTLYLGEMNTCSGALCFAYLSGVSFSPRHSDSNRTTMDSL